MRKIIFTVALATMALACSTQSFAQKPFKLNGVVSEGLHDVRYLLYFNEDNFDYSSSTPSDTIDVNMKNRTFTITKKIKEPRRAFLQAIFDDGSICPVGMGLLFIPGETANLVVKDGTYDLTGKDKFYSAWSKVDNNMTPSQMAYMDVTQKIKNFQKDNEELIKAYSKAMEEYRDLIDEMEKKRNDMEEYAQKLMKENPNDEATLMYMLQHGYANRQEIYENAGDKVKNGRFGQMLKELAEKEKKAEEERKLREVLRETNKSLTAEGNMFKDFEVEYDGQVQKLSDYVGKGKYVLVDFWASWCSPCRAEIPNLIKIWEKYKGDKFEVLGVATWDTPNDTKKAMKDLGIEYPQIMNAQNIGSDAYGVSGIPQIILFGPDGKIHKRDLRGSQIEKVLKEYL